MKILFLDIDGVLLPGRAYMLPNQTKPWVTKFDPCAVSMLNNLCKETGYKIVLHSSWIRSKFIEDTLHKGNVVEHCIEEGIEAEHFYEKPYCNRDLSYRYDRVNVYLLENPEVTEFIIIDDEPCLEEYSNKDKLYVTNFDEGITLNDYRNLLARMSKINT